MKSTKINSEAFPRFVPFVFFVINSSIPSTPVRWIRSFKGKQT